MAGYEVNFDGLVGLTHHYAGLSFGNEASTLYQNRVSNPKLAAKQGLLKMKALADLGFQQGVLPPQERPHLPTLRRLGFSGSDEAVLAQVRRTSPRLLSALGSASSMWTANAATVSPSADSADGKVHFTAANLNNKFHRAIEAPTTRAALQAIFNDDRHFMHHPALPQVALFGDEGAANHNRLGGDYGKRSVQVFVYGRQEFGGEVGPSRYPARQTREASEAIARLHQLDERHTVFIQQHPAVIDQGVFHNDVIAVSNQQVLFHHQQAFLHQQQALEELRRKMARLDAELVAIEVPSARVSVADAVATYLFNSQILTKPDGKMMIVVPEESRQHPGVWGYLNEMVAGGGPIDEIKVFDLRESMRNGGGPACLRLRVALNGDELRAVNPRVMMNDTLFTSLNAWVDRFYRDRLTADDLADPQLLREGREALDALTSIMGLGSIYPFQQ
ncbi:N-succinylarginine dihydrolase [Serratia odorifera]|jgi:succinylarginine dihydrolase|uniref:N-succinylarginine dihydrolase n=1 Tax=Serratia odorifera DSM 4582 TaxID=667129 RepID=D4E544_SEROD|nr:N-succinylarginine dihydrolase [Serratia odorifera]EFE94860.1 succinylarginine dihydrolase [Serratia odorifera DSM 4582]PNK89825.1 N-succinylarginine dihydrolase [Serratia odorifera]RII70591.1 N-succinylarginine dihydrolase [Serratia odorifera]HEJ9094077.1 N-succinylarginine dihydrolase [Serratia odorifera]HEJ9098233.1 N-succinylarginine dihydrolase [Serratia odorifera]